MRIFPRELDDFMFTRVTVCLHTIFLWTTDARSLVVGSPQLTIAAPGDDVTLRCHLEPPVDIQGLTVEWSRPDLRPDPADPLRRVGYVHLYRSRHEVTDMKLRSYAGRTELFTEQLRGGNIWLRILNVTQADAGRYRCFVPKLHSPVKEAVVQLGVDPNYVRARPTEPQLDPRDSQTPDPSEDVDTTAGLPGRSYVIPAVMFSIVLILGAGIGCFLKHNNQEQTTTASTKFAAVPSPG